MPIASKSKCVSLLMFKFWGPNWSHIFMAAPTYYTEPCFPLVSRCTICHVVYTCTVFRLGGATSINARNNDQDIFIPFSNNGYFFVSAPKCRDSAGRVRLYVCMYVCLIIFIANNALRMLKRWLEGSSQCSWTCHSKHVVEQWRTNHRISGYKEQEVEFKPG